MKPITRLEQFLATAAGEYEGTLPPPKTREDIYLLNIIEKINSLGMTPQEIDTAIAEYLNTHDADIVTEQELSDALAGYYDKGDMDTLLSGKADAVDIPDVSSFIDADVDNLTNYYDKDAVDTTLNEKQDTLTAGDNISIETVNGELTISADTPAPTDVQVQTAVDNYLDQNGVVFNTSAEITEVLNGN